MNTIIASQINVNAPTQLRILKESQKHIEELAHSYATEGKFSEKPWIGLVKETNEYVPIDGFHRVRAFNWLSSEDYKKAEGAIAVGHLDLVNIEVTITEFNTMAEAIIAAAGVNSNHGLARQKGDIKNAIKIILELDKARFMDGEFKLNAEAIMAVVKCSDRTYRVETKELRDNLESHRDFTISCMAEEGLSQREIEKQTGVSQKTVSRILAESKRQDAKVTQFDSEGESEWHDAKVTQEDSAGESERHDAKVTQEEPTAFTHITSVSPVVNPWEVFESPVTESLAGEIHSFSESNRLQVESKSEVIPSTGMTDDQLCQLLAGLSSAQQDLARRFLENL